MSNDHPWEAKKYDKPTPTSHEQAPRVIVRPKINMPDHSPTTDEEREAAMMELRKGYVRGVNTVRKVKK